MLDAMRAIFKKATGVELSVKFVDDKGRDCLAWLIEDDRDMKRSGGVEYLSLSAD